MVLQQHGATCLMVLNVTMLRTTTCKQTIQWLYHCSSTSTHTRWPPGCCGVFSAAVCAAKSHSLSNGEVQKTQREMVRDREQAVYSMNVCVSGWRSQSLWDCMEVYMQYMWTGSVFQQIRTACASVCFHGRERMEQTEGTTSDNHMCIWIKPF